MSLEQHREKIKAEKRRAALDAAVVTFLQNGYDRTTLVQIARNAGISTGTLFKHFPTKAELFGAIMEEMWDADPSLDQPIPPVGSPRSGLISIGHDYADKLLHPQTEPFFRVIIAEVPRFPELGKALFERGKQPYLEKLNDYLRAEAQAGTLEIKDISLAGRQFFGMINDMIFWPRFLSNDLTFSSAEIAYVIDEAVETILARYSQGINKSEYPT